MSVFVSTTYYGDGSKIQEAIDELHRMDINHVELGSNHAPCDVQTLRLYPDTRYIAHNYFAPQDPNFVLNLASENKEIREKSIAFIKSIVKICQKLGIKFYTIHPGFLGDVTVSKDKEEKRNFDFKFEKNESPINHETVVQTTVQIIKKLHKFAANHDVQLLIENEGSKTSSQFVIFDNPEELDLLKKTVGDNLKFNFNLAHAILAGVRLEDPKVFSHFYNSAEFFEVSEIAGNLDSHLPLGPGNGKVLNLLKNFKSLFLRKNIILEYRNIKSWDLLKSFNFVNKFLSQG